MEIFFETVIYLISMFGIVIATYFCFTESYIDKKLLNSDLKLKNTNKKIEIYLYNMEKNEEEEIVNKIDENYIENVNVNVYKVIDKN